MVASVAPLYAQKPNSRRFGAADNPPISIVKDSTFDINPAADEENCFPWTLSAVQSTTVSAPKLNVPPKARVEYDKACGASNGNRFVEAERHVRGAINKFQDYSAAWVMLGVILEEQQKSQEAREACSHAAAIDSTYLPAYFCAAEISVRDRAWEQVLNWADLALALKSDGDPYAYYYRAIAYFYMGNAAEAKKSALQAAAVDANHDEPSLYLLMAEIYEHEGDAANSVAQLRQFLKRPTSRQQEHAAKQLLAKIESQKLTK